MHEAVAEVTFVPKCAALSPKLLFYQVFEKGKSGDLVAIGRQVCTREICWSAYFEIKYCDLTLPHCFYFFRDFIHVHFGKAKPQCFDPATILYGRDQPNPKFLRGVESFLWPNLLNTRSEMDTCNVRILLIFDSKIGEFLKFGGWKAIPNLAKLCKLALPN